MKRDKYDALLSTLIRERADWTCESCFKVFPERKGIGLHCSHFYGRKWSSTRYDPDNLFALCYACHDYLGSKPDEHAAWVRQQLGDVRYDELRKRWRRICRWRKKDKEQMYLHYKRELHSLLDRRSNGEVGYLNFVLWE